MAEYKCMSIELTKGYGNFEFREDIKKLFIIAGVERKQVSTLLLILNLPNTRHNADRDKKFSLHESLGLPPNPPLSVFLRGRLYSSSPTHKSSTRASSRT